MLRVVADTNVLVSGTLVANGPSAKILAAARNREIILLASQLLLAEYSEVIHRRHILKKYPEVNDYAEDLINFFSANSELVEADSTLAGFVPNDPQDDFIVACAVKGKADYIVSGDPHLTELGTVAGISILTPAQFASKLMRVE